MNGFPTSDEIRKGRLSERGVINGIVKGQRFPDWKEVERPSCILFQMQRPNLLVDQITCNYASRQSPEVACRMSEKLCFRNESRTSIVNLIRGSWDHQITTASTTAIESACIIVPSAKINTLTA
jgi:hypothetical protein